MTTGQLTEYLDGTTKPVSYLTLKYPGTLEETIANLKKRRPPCVLPQLRIWWEGTIMHEIHTVPALYEGDTEFEIHQILKLHE